MLLAIPIYARRSHENEEAKPEERTEDWAEEGEEKTEKTKVDKIDKKEKYTESAEKKGEYIDLTKNIPKEPSPDVFKKLSKIIDKDKVVKSTKEEKKPSEDISKLSKQATKDIKRDFTWPCSLD